MPKVTAEHRQARRRQIANAAMRCFARKGFQAATMADIIEESGLSAGAIYGHYASKNDIVLLVANEVVAHRFTTNFAESASLIHPTDALAHLLRELWEDLEHTTGMLLQVWAEAISSEEMRDIAITVIERLQGILGHYLEQWFIRQEGLTPAVAAEKAGRYLPLLLGVAQGFIVQSALFPDFDQDRYLESLTAITIT